jgi:hypothetical protein
LCNFSTKFHSSNLIIVLTFPFLLACTLPTAPCTSKASSRLQRPQLQTPPSTNETDQSHSHTVNIPERHYPYFTSCLIHSFIQNFITNHFYSRNLSLNPMWPIITQAVRRRLFIAGPRVHLLATCPENRGTASDFPQCLLCFLHLIIPSLVHPPPLTWSGSTRPLARGLNFWRPFRRLRGTSVKLYQRSHQQHRFFGLR